MHKIDPVTIDSNIHPLTGEDRSKISIYHGEPRELIQLHPHEFDEKRRRARFRLAYQEAKAELEAKDNLEDRLNQKIEDLQKVIEDGFNKLNQSIEGQYALMGQEKLNKWIEAHPHYPKVKDMMCLLLKTDEKGMGELLVKVGSSQALEPSYQTACWANEDIRKILLEERNVSASQDTPSDDVGV